ncbi:MAG: phosphate ABC transporter substrate-binding protein [Ignavibacteriales bacterium]|nr:phosphate ABC transporter substrate-binding protein [Ignavibacteriales bacterium]MCB9217925.1 phosphate ABC transporter substrate-binding protein [Ignavibacteriales bacterium]MCB9260314.1 phosphate ABC transporter substrate-binding protein [Ignavibacteriales bacterium]
MKKSKKIFTVITLLLSALILLSSCKKKEEVEKTVVSVKGSDTMVNLSQKWAEAYMQKNLNASIQVTGGGSGTGIAALLNSTVDLANASRELKQKEYDRAKELGLSPQEFKVALDGIAVIVHPSNKIDALTVAQLRDIFTGAVTNWKQVGGSDIPIVLYGRENSSGTYEFFKEHVLGKDEQGNTRDFANSTQVLQGTAALGEAVARDDEGIGYGGVGYFAARTDVKIIQVKADDASPAIAPAADGKVNYEAIWNGDYSISRYLYCYTNGTPDEKIQDFMNFILSKEGQDLVKQMEYIPLPEK